MPVYNIIDFGASGDGATLNTPSIQHAIDTCASEGGGTVYIPAGRFLSGTLELKTNVELHLESGAVLLASTCRDDYRKTFPECDSLMTDGYDCPINKDEHFIVALGADNVRITGPGTIDAQGSAFYQMDRTRKCIKLKPDGVECLLKDWRPGAVVSFLDCRNVTVKDVTMIESPMFTVEFMHCNLVHVTDITIRCNPKFINGDGLHFKSTQNVFITGCQIDAEDDALCFYTDYWDRKDWQPRNQDFGCSNILVKDCIFSSCCSAMRFGFLGDDSIRNVVVNGIVIKHAETMIDFLCCGGTSYFSTSGENPGTLMQDFSFNNIYAENCKWGITANCHPSITGDAVIRKMNFTNIHVTSTFGNYLSGTPGHCIDTITFRDCSFTVKGGTGTVSQLPEPLPLFKNETFPYTFILRHVRNIRMENTAIDPTGSGWSTFSEDA